MDKLEGLELRKAVLQKVGWSVVMKNKRWLLYTPDGTHRGHACFEESHAWGIAPAVESSVDAALTWLTLGDTCGWQIHWPMADTDSPAGQVTIMNYQNRRTYSALFRTNAAAAMCDAYRSYKAGA